MSTIDGTEPFAEHPLDKALSGARAAVELREDEIYDLINRRRQELGELVPGTVSFESALADIQKAAVALKSLQTVPEPAPKAKKPAKARKRKAKVRPELVGPPAQVKTPVPEVVNG